jgi:uncharacterized membrane protein YgdD (TMEM256/DUF423 family)
MNNRLLIIAASLMAIAIVLGAFGAHALQAKLSSEQLLSFETGVRYQVYHAIGLLILAFNCDKLHPKTCKLATLLMLTGLACFSGSIYLFTLGHLIGESFSSMLWWITPLGGLLLIISWLIFIKAGLKAHR